MQELICLLPSLQTWQSYLGWVRQSEVAISVTLGISGDYSGELVSTSCLAATLRGHYLKYRRTQ